MPNLTGRKLRKDKGQRHNVRSIQVRMPTYFDWLDAVRIGTKHARITAPDPIWENARVELTNCEVRSLDNASILQAAGINDGDAIDYTDGTVRRDSRMGDELDVQRKHEGA